MQHKVDFTLTAEQETTQLLNSIVNDLTEKQLDKLSSLITLRKLKLKNQTHSVQYEKINEFIVYVCYELSINSLNTTRTERRTMNYWICLLYHLHITMGINPAHIAKVIGRDRSLVVNHSRKCEQLMNIYTEESKVFKQQRKEFLDVARRYNNGRMKVDLVNELVA